MKKIENCNISAQISNFRHLKELKIDAIAFLSEVEELPLLEILVVFGLLPLKLNQIIHKFPNLRTIEMHYSRLFYDEEEFMKAYGRISFPFELKRLKIIDSTVGSLKTKSIKSLVLKNVKICEDFFTENPQIEEISIENCEFGDEIFKKLTENFTKLKKLTIIDEKITQTTIDEVERNCHHLNILRLKKIKREFDLKKLLAGNRNLKVFVN